MLFLLNLTHLDNDVHSYPWKLFKVLTTSWIITSASSMKYVLYNFKEDPAVRNLFCSAQKGAYVISWLPLPVMKMNTNNSLNKNKTITS